MGAYSENEKVGINHFIPDSSRVIFGQVGRAVLHTMKGMYYFLFAHFVVGISD